MYANHTDKPIDPTPHRWRDLFAIDLRSLAVVRIGIGVLLVLDTLLRFPDLRAFYTDAGVLPVEALFSVDGYSLSLHSLSGEWWVQAGLLAIQLMAAGCFAVGYRARLSGTALFVLYSSLLNRNPVVAHAGDMFMRVVLFWLLFLPTGARWSIDARGRDVAQDPTRTRSICSAALLLQICIVYWFTGLLKSHYIWWGGAAIGYAFNLDMFATGLAKSLLSYPSLLRAMTWAVLAVELLGPFIALSPWANARMRVAAVALFWTMHLGMAMTLELGLFPYACMIAWCAFLPGEFWALFRRRDWTFLAPRRYPLRPVDALPLARPSRAMQVCVAAMFVYVLLWNVRTLSFDRLGRWYPSGFDFVGQTFQVGQYWALFAPFPATDDGWYVIPARLDDASEIDLLTGRPPRWNKPADVAATYQNPRWRKYLGNLYHSPSSDVRRHFAQYLCREWKAAYPSKSIVDFEICYMLERTVDATTADPPRKIVLWTHRCE